MHLIRKHHISLRVLIFYGFGPDFGIRDMPRWLYLVFHEESESGVEPCKILQAGGKTWEKPTLGISGSNFLFNIVLFDFVGV